MQPKDTIIKKRFLGFEQGLFQKLFNETSFEIGT